MFRLDMGKRSKQKYDYTGIKNKNNSWRWEWIEKVVGGEDSHSGCSILYLCHQENVSAGTYFNLRFQQQKLGWVWGGCPWTPLDFLSFFLQFNSHP